MKKLLLSLAIVGSFSVQANDDLVRQDEKSLFNSVFASSYSVKIKDVNGKTSGSLLGFNKKIGEHLFVGFTKGKFEYVDLHGVKIGFTADAGSSITKRSEFFAYLNQDILSIGSDEEETVGLTVGVARYRTNGFNQKTSIFYSKGSETKSFGLSSGLYYGTDSGLNIGLEPKLTRLEINGHYETVTKLGLNLGYMF